MKRARRAMTLQLFVRGSGSGFVCRRLAQLALDRARTINDAREPAGQHAEKHTDARQQEHRRQRQLDRMGNVDDFQPVHARTSPGKGRRTIVEELRRVAAARTIHAHG